ncbi:hypothetical protein ACFE04_009121 [Oxalis oulophora]
MYYLKKAVWSEGVGKQSNGNDNHDNGGATPDETASTVVGELVDSLKEERIYREITLALRTGLRDVRAEFSFLRLRGLHSLLEFLRSVSESDSTIHLFSHSQSVPQLQVVPVLFQHSLKEPADGDNSVDSLNHIFGVEPMNITSPSTDSEIAVALRVLEGCCLLHKPSTVLANKHNAIQVLINILSIRGAMEQAACLDALISIMLDSSANQMDFETRNGIEEVAELITDKEVDENLSVKYLFMEPFRSVRLKCGEFLLLLIGHVNSREKSPMATIHEDIRRLLGEKSASLIWAASQFGSTLNPEQRLTALHIQARRVLESLNSY